MSKGWLPITWENIGRRIKQLFSSELNYLVEVGEIELEELNDAYADGVEELDFVFTNSKPANTMFIKPVFVVIEDIVSYSGVTITSIVGVETFTFAEVNDKFPKDKANNITVTVHLSAENAMDWTSGKIKVYALVTPYTM